MLQMWPKIALSRPPVAFVIGTTGAGKTKLAVELASRFSGEVVNGDAIQLYQGLNIASAKATVEEASGIPHHLFSFLPPTQEFTVRDFACLAGAAIQDIHARGKLPVVVGGTMYYTQALLSHTMLDSSMGDGHGQAGDDSAPSHYALPGGGNTLVLGGPTPPDSVLDRAFAELVHVDSLTAQRLHRRDWRKVTRALQVFASTGKPQSQVFREQANALVDWSCPYSVRVLWPHSERGVLTDRLNARVDGMLQGGLLQEVRALYDTVQGTPSSNPTADATREAGFVGASELTQRLWGEHTVDSCPPRDGSVVGALQAIGFREFQEYLNASHGTEHTAAAAAHCGSAAVAASVEDDALLQAALETLRLRTRQYAMKQLSWIRNRFIKRGLTVHELDSSDVLRWDRAVGGPASRMVQEMLAGKCNEEQSVPSASDSKRLETWEKFICTVCGIECVGPSERRQHLASGKHRRALAAEAALPKQWLAMYHNMRERGAGHADAQAKVQAVPRFSQLDHAGATAAVTAAATAGGGLKRARED